MKNFFTFLVSFGFNPLKTIKSLQNLPYFFNSLLKYSINNNSEFKITSLLPILSDRNDFAGDSKGVYFKQDLIVSEKIFRKKPINHIDFGSRVDGFISNIATFMKVDVSDIRGLKSDFKNIDFKKMDLTENLTNKLKYDSVSCLHALEHFGLGRYGDPINPNGHLIGFKNILSFLSEDGLLYFSTPIGKKSLLFNAHRIFSIKYLIDMFEDNNLECVEFDFIDDYGKIHLDADLTLGIDDNFNLSYGCGIFVLKFK